MQYAGLTQIDPRARLAAVARTPARLIVVPLNSGVGHSNLESALIPQRDPGFFYHSSAKPTAFGFSVGALLTSARRRHDLDDPSSTRPSRDMPSSNPQ